MQIIEKLEEFVAKPDQPIVLTIGNFDGMHKGHCSVLKKVKALAGNEGEAVVLTFSNHPSEVLRPEQSTCLLCTLSHRLRLLDEMGMNKVVLIPFTRFLAQRSAASFIEQVRQYIPFTQLVLGYDATLGRDRQGDRSAMQALGMTWGFHVHYLEEYRFEGKAVSSTRIREALKIGDFVQVEELLDRPYSIFAPVISGEGKGKELGFPTANLNVSGLCLPPFGVYAVEVKNKVHANGIANLGKAPTLKNSAEPILEVHLFDSHEDLTGQELDVIFKYFVRPEQKFKNHEELRNQIERDIAAVKASSRQQMG